MDVVFRMSKKYFFFVESIILSVKFNADKSYNTLGFNKQDQKILNE